MRKKTIFLFILFLSIYATNLLAEKHALVIGVGTYPADSGWQNLSAENDVHHIISALQLNGFPENNFIKLLNEKATKSNIVDAFYYLQQSVEKGDIVFVHFSGHGQQIVDNNGDEIDRLDEAIVPYDSPKKYSAGYYEGERLIRDDELQDMTVALRRKLGNKGQLILVLDACHSGTGTRGKVTVRGTNVVMAPPSFKKDKKTLNTEKSMGITDYKDIQNLAPMASFFGSSANEANYQTRDDQFQPIGILSYVISSLLANGFRQMTFQEMYERIQLRMKAIRPRQNPQWEGPKNELVFGGYNYEEGLELYPILEQLDKQTLKAQIGTLIGVYEASQIEIYSVDQQRIINEGFVSKSNLTSAIIALNTPLQAQYDELLKVRIKAKAQMLLKTYIQFDVPPTSKWANVITDIQRNSFIEENRQYPDLYISVGNDDSQLLLQTVDGTNLFKTKSTDVVKGSVSYQLIRIIKSYTQGKFLRGYEGDQHQYQFAIQLLATDSDEPAINIHQLHPITENKIKVGTNIQIAITNQGTTPAYFSLLDIQPDNQLNLLLPLPDFHQTAEDFYLQPGDTYLTDFVMGISAPFGEETLKLICTDKPLDLAAIIQKRGKASRGEGTLHPFEQVLGLSFQDDSRGGQTMSATGVAEVGTVTRFFQIEQ